jgi:membrane protein involved in colicin uptake
MRGKIRLAIVVGVVVMGVGAFFAQRAHDEGQRSPAIAAGAAQAEGDARTAAERVAAAKAHEDFLAHLAVGKA